MSTMDVHALAQTPVFLFSLVITGLVAAYSCSVFVRWILARFSIAAATAAIPPIELLAVDLANRFHEQRTLLRQRVDAVAKLSNELPAPFKDQSWTKLLDTCDTLEGLQVELNTFIRVRDFPEGIKLGRFLTGTGATAPSLLKPIEEEKLLLVANWRGKTTALLQRMVAKLEDASLSKVRSDGRPLSPDFFKALNEIRQVIIEDEKRFQ